MAGANDSSIPVEPGKYRERLRRIQQIVNNVDEHYQWAKRSVYGKPGRTFNYKTQEHTFQGAQQ